MLSLPAQKTENAKSRAALLSVASNSVLVALKLGVGLYIGSVAVISEAIHSGIDLVAKTRPPHAWGMTVEGTQPSHVFC